VPVLPFSRTTVDALTKATKLPPGVSTPPEVHLGLAVGVVGLNRVLGKSRGQEGSVGQKHSAVHGLDCIGRKRVASDMLDEERIRGIWICLLKIDPIVNVMGSVS
jgi:hypothetical protein